MENLHIEPTDEEPRVDFNAENGILEISGNSYPEDTSSVFKPIIDWLTKYTEAGGKKVQFNFKMEYFNTSTFVKFQKILKLLEDYHLNNDGDVEVNWYYEKSDLDMFDNGEDYQADVEIPFNMIAY